MKKLCDITNPVKLSLIKTELDAAQVQYIIKNDFTPGMDVYFGNVVPEIWIVEDGQMAKAKVCLSAIDSQAGEAWVCPKCSEQLEGQFNECWKCGYVKE